MKSLGLAEHRMPNAGSRPPRLSSPVPGYGLLVHLHRTGRARAQGHCAPAKRLRSDPCPLRATGPPGHTRSPHMAKFTNLRVWQQARELLKLVSAITADMRAEGDLKSQL